MQVPSILQGKSLNRLLQGDSYRCGRVDSYRIFLGRLDDWQHSQ